MQIPLVISLHRWDQSRMQWRKLCISLHQHLKEADFWMAAAQATRNAGTLSTGLIDAGTGPASTLVVRLRDNRQAFRHWLKASQ